VKRWAPALAAVLCALALAAAFGVSPSPYPSATSATPSGLKVAARYLAARGRDVSFLTDGDPGAAAATRGAAVETEASTEAVATEETTDAAPTADVLFVAFPVARAFTAADAIALARWVSDGGRLVLLPSTTGPLPGPVEDAFTLVSVEDQPGSPGSWDEWKDARAAATRLDGPVGALQVSEGPYRVNCPERASVSYRDGNGWSHVCTFPRGDGTVTLVNDVTVLTNAHLAAAADLAFLEALAPPGARVRFDEYHQGGSAGGEIEGAARLDAVVAQAGLLYLLVAWRRARPLGPPRPGLADREAGMVGELRTLGQLHAAGGHGVDAARRLLAMARGRFAGDERIAALPPDIDSLPAAIAVGRRIAELERRNP
jgi:V8-like Glu-specific endopeptidase